MTDFNPQPSALLENKRQHSHRSRTVFWVSMFSIILAIIAIIVAFWSYAEYKTVKSDTHDASISHTAEQQALQAQLLQLQTAVITTQQNVTALMRRIGNSQQQATMSQIAYLINLANLQLNVSRDTTSALQMLSLAQIKLDSLNDPRFFALNNTLIKDIAKLKTAPKLNLTQIISNIDMLNDAIADATLLPNQKDLNNAIAKSVTNAVTQSNQPSTWYGRLWHVIASVKHLIIIRKNDPDVQPLLDIQQQQLVKSMLQSKLLLAEYAATQHNNALFQNDLGMIKKWIKKYFFESDSRNSLLKKLKALQTNNVDLTIPNINDTLTILNQTLNDFVDAAMPSMPNDAAPAQHITRAAQPDAAAPQLPRQTTPTPKKKTTANTTSTTPVNDNAGVAI